MRWGDGHWCCAAHADAGSSSGQWGIHELSGKKVTRSDADGAEAELSPSERRGVHKNEGDVNSTQANGRQIIS